MTFNLTKKQKESIRLHWRHLIVTFNDVKQIVYGQRTRDGAKGFLMDYKEANRNFPRR